jgi:hypothetical protein
MAIKQSTLKLLWANAAGRCSFTNCQARLCTDDAGDAAPFTIGEMAHICGDKPGANRHNPALSDDERDGYSNLILLCPTHHSLIDKSENEKRYSAEVLSTMKAAHEAFVAGRLNPPEFKSKDEIATFIYPLLQENHEVFAAYGPHSEIARRNPEAEAHGVWLSERLATIVPNNRQIAELLEANKGLFPATEQAVLARFLVHARGYQRWVLGEVDYEAVIPFPAEFETIIAEAAHAAA